MAYRSLFRFKLLVAIYIRDISTITKSSLFVWLATFTRVIMVTTTTVWVRAGATHSPKVALTLVSRGEGIPTVLADVFPSCEKRGTGQRCWEISLTPKNLRSSSSHFRLVVLHSHMLSQPLFRGCFVLTLVTFWFFRSSCIIKWDPTWRILLLLVQKISPRLAFLQSVEGLVLFLTRGPFISLLLVSMEKEKEGPMEMEMLKAWPWLASAWQKSKHLESMGESTMSTPAILVLLLN